MWNMPIVNNSVTDYSQTTSSLPKGYPENTAYCITTKSWNGYVNQNINK
jgi:hypothetical protein